MAMNVNVDLDMMTKTERAYVEEALAKHISSGTDYQHHDAEFRRAKVARALNLNAELLPVGHCEKTNAALFGEVCQGVEACYAGDTAAAKRHFAVVERAHYDVQVSGKVPTAADGAKNLRWTYKEALRREWDSSRTCYRRLLRATALGYFHKYKVWNEHLDKFPRWVAASIAGSFLVFGLFADKIDDCILRSNPDQLAMFGPADDETPFAARCARVVEELRSESASGRETVRDAGWLNGWGWMSRTPWFHFA